MRELKRLDAPVLFMNDDGTYRKYNEFTLVEKIVYISSIVVVAALMAGLFLVVRQLIS